MKSAWKLGRFVSHKTMDRHSVFCYGTLKRGEPNHHWLENNRNGCAKFISKGKTVTRYPLVIASKYNIPFLLHSPGKGEQVVGELYEIDEQMLRSLDVLEDHPTFYVREIDQIQIISEEENENVIGNNEQVECWVYFLKQFKPSLLSEPFLKEYHSKADHTKPYAPRQKRIPGWHARNDVLLP